MPDKPPFKLGIDHSEKRLIIEMQNTSGKNLSVSLDANHVAAFITTLSQCQHALILSMAGQEVDLPLNPLIAFRPVAGLMALGAYEGVSKLSVGTDDLSGTVALTMLSPSGRLSGFRIGAETARHLGAGLLKAADLVTSPATKQ
jgi:hypothetical protein